MKSEAEPQFPNILAPVFQIRHRSKWYFVSEALQLASAEIKRGNSKAALEICDLVLAKTPDSLEAYACRGNALFISGQYEEAVANFDLAVRLKPEHAPFYLYRGLAEQAVSQWEKSLASYDQAIALQPSFATAHNNRGIVLQNLRRFEEASLSFEQAIAQDPTYTLAYFNHGDNLVKRGKLPDAEKILLQAIALKPDFPEPLLTLTSIRKYESVEHEDVKRITAMLRYPHLSKVNRWSLYFSLGKIYDDCSEYDRAFEAYAQGNNLCHAEAPYRLEEVTKTTDEIIEVFNKDFLAAPYPGASPDASPVFVVGMPRSGTTLLTSILSNHPLVANAGELPTMEEFAVNLPKITEKEESYPKAILHLTPTITERLIGDYTKRLKQEINPNFVYFVDKNPLNFRYLGLIAKLFPRSRVIHCVRHPLDTALSNYFQRFSLHHNFSFDLGAIGHFYREYLRLMEHWKEVLPLQMVEINYEDMVHRTEEVARKALDLLELDWDARCLTPHTNSFAVETASVWQVRQPVYDRSIGRWKHYEKHLGPMQQALGLMAEPS